MGSGEVQKARQKPHFYTTYIQASNGPVQKPGTQTYQYSVQQTNQPPQQQMRVQGKPVQIASNQQNNFAYEPQEPGDFQRPGFGQQQKAAPVPPPKPQNNQPNPQFGQPPNTYNQYYYKVIENNLFFKNSQILGNSSRKQSASTCS